MSDQRQKIISSVFSRRNATGNLEENYVSHVKIWEDAGPEGGGRKPRYILLSRANNGTGFIHKSKLNTNGTFSVGKTWRLAELRGIQVVNPLAFNITLSRTYRWQTENQADQSSFLEALVRLFRLVAPGAQLHLEGLIVLEESTAEARNNLNTVNLSARTPSPTRISGSLQPPTTSRLDRESDSSHSIPASLRPRNRPEPASAGPLTGNSNRSHSPNSLPRDLTSNRTRPSSTAEQRQPTTPRSKYGRRPSNAGSQDTQVSSINALPQATPVDVPSSSPFRSSQNNSSIPSTHSLSPPIPAPLTSDNSRMQSSRADAANKLASRRDQNARISLYDPTNQGTLDRLINGGRGPHSEGETDDENAIATMSSVEEMIEGYEWASDNITGRQSARGAADLIEARLLDELMGLEKANIHSFLESDDRIGVVLKYMDDAISELDNMDSLVSSYKIHLNTVSDDISYIQSQNRGLQVQTQNQRALLNELQKLVR